MIPADIAASGLASPALEVSLLGMFWSAHFVVKLVMLGLLGASVWCWAIIINKMLLFSKTQRAMAKFEEIFWSGASLDELYATLSSRPASGMAALFVAAMREWRRSVQGAASSFMGLQARIEKVLDVSIAREVEKLESSLLVLATVASAGPFIGLFGTVWGIMTAFRSIAASRNTSLAVVAPGRLAGMKVIGIAFAHASVVSRRRRLGNFAPEPRVVRLAMFAVEALAPRLVRRFQLRRRDCAAARPTAE